MEPALLSILEVLILSGIFGGLVNFVRTYIPTDQRIDVSDRSKWGWHLVKCLMTGTAAAFLVPLFLKMISSDVISLEDGKSDYLVLIGFCLVASIFSNRFIDSISEQLLKKVQEVEDTSQHALAISEKNESDLAVIVENTTDVTKGETQDVDELEGNLNNGHRLGEQQGEAIPELNDVEDREVEIAITNDALKWGGLNFGSARLLTRLQHDSSIFFTFEGIRSLMGWHDEKLHKHLDQLILLDMVRVIERAGDIRYSLTLKGNKLKIPPLKLRSV